MKSARERAEEHVRFADDYEGSRLTMEELVERLALSFNEHARDQRHLCAAAVTSMETEFGERVSKWSAHSVAMNTPAPGLSRIPKELAK